jgi:hypothetical protein
VIGGAIIMSATQQALHESRTHDVMCKIRGARRPTVMSNHMSLARLVSRPAAVAALLVLSTACSTMGRSAMGRPASSAPDAVPAALPKQATLSDVPAERGQAGIGRLLIRRAEMRLDDVEDPERVARRVTAMTAALGGFVEHSRESEGSIHLKVRVPADLLETAMDSVATLGKVDRRQISADDVTEQVVDLNARVATRRAIRDRLRALLERASEIDDVIRVERELARVQGELDLLERRLEYLRGSSSMAELDVEARRKRILGPIGAVAVALGWLIQKAFIIR